jgi:hypothetical protein
LGRSRQHNRRSIRQRLSNGLERLPPHDQDVAGRHFLEPPEIFRQMPRDFVSRTDNTIERHGGDGFEWLHQLFKED